jgi:hypothetical protein
MASLCRSIFASIRVHSRFLSFICVNLRSSAVEKFCVRPCSTANGEPRTVNASRFLSVVDSTVVNREPALTMLSVDFDESSVPKNVFVSIIDRALNWSWNHCVDTDDGGHNSAITPLQIIGG